MVNSSQFADDLKEQGIDLEAVIKGCKEIILDYSWYSRYSKTGYSTRNFITLYVIDGVRRRKQKKVKRTQREIARVFINTHAEETPEIIKILSEAYKSLKSKIPKGVKVKAYYLKEHPNEQFLCYLNRAVIK